MTADGVRRSWSGVLGRNQLVDARAEIAENEILLGGRLAVVDLLRPLFQRQLDAERLVDREGDVEEVQAVDAEVVDRVAFRRDGVAWYIAGLGNDVGNLIEGRHRKPLI